MTDKVELILPTSWEPNRETFLIALGVSLGSLGEQLFGNVYSALFTSSIELKEEFNKYYSVEYSNLAKYLKIRYGRTLSEEDLEASRVFMVTSLPQVIDNAYDNNKLDTVLECVKKLEEAQGESQI